MASAVFEGYKFWLAQRVPCRLAYVDKVTAHGGRVVQLEKQADWLIADHLKPNSSPLGSISYEFIDQCIAKRRLLDPDGFPAAPALGTARDPGSLARPAKGTRAAYTPDDDGQLYKWVRDAQARGVAVSGNELYKQLEAQNPRHTWQSWRDRYLKKLQHMTPSAFSMPDHSSRAAEVPIKRPALLRNKDKPTEVPVKRPALIKNKDKSAEPPREPHYTVDQLAAIFSTRDWEKLYAFVDDIDSRDEHHVSYEATWQYWAEKQDNQTAAQWRQYYEKVVRPQWERDLPSKRARVKKKLIDRHNDTSSPAKSQTWSQSQDAAQHTANGHDSALKRSRRDADADADADAAPHSTHAPRPTKIPRTTSASTPPGQDVVHVSGDQGQPDRSPPAAPPSQVIIIDLGDEPESDASDDGLALPAPLPRPAVERDEDEGDDVEEEDDKEEEDEEDEGEEQEEDVEDDDLQSVASTDPTHLAPLPRPHPIPEGSDDDDDDDDDDLQSVASTDLTHIAPLPRPPRIPEGSDDDDDDLPSNTPTPRANQYAAFDTQAILSPSQNPHFISRLPRPPLDSSPLHHPDSEASTTQSLQEFSSYLKDDEPLTPQTHAPNARPPASPTPSIASTTSSSPSSPADPDPPLAAAEIEPFFRAHNTAGFSDPFISKALKRTRFRPALAEAVLHAWGAGLALPARRGVWSVREDELVQSGDGAALARLERKHTLDGWGGITERINFLRAWERGD